MNVSPLDSHGSERSESEQSSAAFHGPRSKLADDELIRHLKKVEGGYRILGECILFDKVGEGGMGVVYQGYSLKLQLPVAVKCMRSSEFASKEEIKRFKREVRLTAAINSENLVRIFDTGFDHGVFYQVLEWIEGESLSALVRYHRSLSASQAITVMRKVTRGLMAAHQRDVIHRDIKPANVMISSRGDVKLLDLGIAKSKSTTSNATLTGERAVLGTPGFMAPEQWTSAEAADARADVYSLGATFYYILTGEVGIQGDSQFAKMKSTVDRDFPRLRSLLPKMDQALDELIAQATRRDPKDRYQSAEEWSDALTALGPTEEVHLERLVQGRKSHDELTPTPEFIEKVRRELSRSVDADTTPTMGIWEKRRYDLLRSKWTWLASASLLTGILFMLLRTGKYGDGSPRPFDNPSKSGSLGDASHMIEGAWTQHFTEGNWAMGVKSLEMALSQGEITATHAMDAIASCVLVLDRAFDGESKIELLWVSSHSDIEAKKWGGLLNDALFTCAKQNEDQNRLRDALVFATLSRDRGHEGASTLVDQIDARLQKEWEQGVDLGGFPKTSKLLKWKSAGIVREMGLRSQAFKMSYAASSEESSGFLPLAIESGAFTLDSEVDHDGRHSFLLTIEETLGWPKTLPAVLSDGKLPIVLRAELALDVLVDATPPKLMVESAPEFLRLEPSEDFVEVKRVFSLSEDGCELVVGEVPVPLEGREWTWSDRFGYGTHKVSFTPRDAIGNVGETKALEFKVGVEGLFLEGWSLTWVEGQPCFSIEGLPPFVKVESWEFLVNVGEEDERSAVVPSFLMAQHETSVGEYLLFLNDTGRPIPDDENYSNDDLRRRPAVLMSSEDGLAYCRWITEKYQDHIPAGYRFNLPSEDQFEVVARRRIYDNAPVYPGGNKRAPETGGNSGSADLANTNGFLSDAELRRVTRGMSQSEVATESQRRRLLDGSLDAMDVEFNRYGGSFLGVLHVAGNVSEYCRFGSGSESSGPLRLRGGSWNGYLVETRSDKFRLDEGPRRWQGIRVVLETE